MHFNSSFYEPVRELPKHHDKQLIPTSEMYHVFISFVFHNKSLKVFLRKKLFELSKYVFSTKYLYPFLMMDAKLATQIVDIIFCS